MKKVILLILICNALVCQGQNISDSSKVIFKKSYLGVNFSPSYSFRILKDKSKSNSKEIQSRNEIESGRFGYTFGINKIIKTNNHFEFSYGLQYSLMGYQSKLDSNDLIGTSFNNANNATYYFTSTTDHVIRRYSFGYLEIPLKVGVRLGKERFKYFADAGVSIGFKCLSRIVFVSHYKDGTKEKASVKNLSKSSDDDINAFGLVSLGVSYELSKKMFVQATPNFRYSLISPLEVNIKEHLWSAGFNFSFYYDLISTKKTLVKLKKF